MTDTASPRLLAAAASDRTESEVRQERRARAINHGVSEALVAESDAAMANGKLLCGLLDAFGGGLK